MATDYRLPAFPPMGRGPTGVSIGQPLPSKPTKGYSEKLTPDKTGGGF